MVQMNIDENRMPGLVAMLNERDVHGIYFLNRFASPPPPPPPQPMEPQDAKRPMLRNGKHWIKGSKPGN